MSLYIIKDNWNVALFWTLAVIKKIYILFFCYVLSQT